jgi:exodeoxyribonuclease-3
LPRCFEQTGRSVWQSNGRVSCRQDHTGVQNMRIVSWNVNGFRACIRHGGMAAIHEYNPDIICMQELKLADKNVDILLDAFSEGVNTAYSLSSISGHSGVSIIAKETIIHTHHSIGYHEFDTQGRFVFTELSTGLNIACLYMPHGGRDKSQIPFKLQAFDHMISFIKNHKEIDMICTDFNVAHTCLDLARPKQNSNNTMFTVRERQMIDTLLAAGFCDSFRYIVTESGYYSWWPYSFNAWERNMGWRIDYIFVRSSLLYRVQDVKILRDIRCSDHSPILIDIEI